MDNFKTPLRYPGGKGSFHKFIAFLLKQNKMVDGCYVEPFCGGAGLGMELLLREYVQHVYLNDADIRLFALWDSIVNETGAFIRLVEDTKISVQEWRIQKGISDHPNGYSRLEIGFATFFLNRCNRSGILGGRPIGGLNQTGPWKIDARFNKRNLIRRIESIGLYGERIHVSGCDALLFLKNLTKNLPYEKAFVYLDPPYYAVKEKLYLNTYSHSDHSELSLFIKKLPFSWVLSYDNVPEIRKIYNDKRTLNITLRYRANQLKQGKELIVFSDDLQIPQIPGDTINI